MLHFVVKTRVMPKSVPASLETYAALSFLLLSQVRLGKLLLAVRFLKTRSIVSMEAGRASLEGSGIEAVDGRCKGPRSCCWRAVLLCPRGSVDSVICVFEKTVCSYGKHRLQLSFEELACFHFCVTCSNLLCLLHDC